MEGALPNMEGALPNMEGALPAGAQGWGRLKSEAEKGGRKVWLRARTRERRAPAILGGEPRREWRLAADRAQPDGLQSRGRCHGGTRAFASVRVRETAGGVRSESRGLAGGSRGAGSRGAGSRGAGSRGREGHVPRTM
eukprot:1134786-Prymnesium_polylepis.1